MAEARNNFLGSKMNKDLEQRLVPNNEYRNAENIMISRSDGDDVGSLENVLGNNLVSTFGLSGSELTNKVQIIGKYMDVANNRVFAFLTDYTDTSSDQLTNFAYSTSKCYICLYDITNNQGTKLVEGYWLNFSQYNPIIGVNLINDLLFWTDNRNQPRKINVNKAINNPGANGYYTCEDQISVSKYYPINAPEFINLQIVAATKTNLGTGYTVNQVVYLIPPLPAVGEVNPAKVIITAITGTGGIDTFRFLDIGNNYGLLGAGNHLCTLASGPNGPAVGGGTITVTVDENCGLQDRTSPLLPDEVAANPFYDADYDGDEDFLKDKFVRFAWRIKFDDNEYSLISPFTQSAFIPQQDGYFITNDQEKAAYTSTELNFMVNKVDYVRVVIKSPYGTWQQAIERFKIKEIDVLYKQSNLNSINIVETLSMDDQLVAPYLNTEYILYDYLSQKPFKTLPQKDLTRVYDKTPVRALSQEVAEDAVVYGNYLDKHTPPSTLPYFVQVDEKWVNDGSITSGKTRIEYQNHTLKQNRNYQVGIVLSDRYGRQSSVILSADNKANTLYHPYRSGLNYNPLDTTGNRLDQNFSYFYPNVQGDHLLTTNGSSSVPNDTWAGDSLKLTFSNIIDSTKNSSLGTPGLYNDFGKVAAIIITNGGTGYSDSSYTDLSSVKGGSGLGISTTTTAGVITGVTVTDPGIGFTIGTSITLSGGGNNAVLEVVKLEEPNPTGWYSYKVVVKQTQNEYYNVYTPGVLSGYIDGEAANIGQLESGQPVGATVSEPIIHLALYGDNINKVPRDLSQLGPTQASFRTGRPSYADDPSYYDFVNDQGQTFSANPYDVDDQIRLKARDRARDLDSGSIITNSSVELYPRLYNYFLFGTSNPTPGQPVSQRGAPPFANDLGKNNIQGYFGTRTVEITTIGTGVELGLWDPAAAQPFNEAYSFFQYETNPLIARGQVPLDSQASVRQAELDYFGCAGPSPFAGKVTYESAQLANLPGDEILPGSKNVGLEVLKISTTSSTPYFFYNGPYTSAPGGGLASPLPTNTYGDLGSKGTGLLADIMLVNAVGFMTEEGNPGLAVDPKNPGTAIGAGFMKISNPNGENGVKGFNVYGFPWHLQETSGVENGTPTPLATNFQYNLQVSVKAGDGKCRYYICVKLNPNPGVMVPQLAVFETQPIESKLDIYWETSTSGLISELNTNVLENDTVTPTSLVGTYAPLSEVSIPKINGSSQTPYAYLLEDIRCLTQGGTEINFGPTTNASIQLLSYYDGVTTTIINNTPVNDRLWDIEINSTSGRAQVYLNIPTWYKSYTSVNLNTYSFQFRVVSPSVNFPIDGTFITNDFTNLNSSAGEPYAITNAYPNFEVSAASLLTYRQVGVGGTSATSGIVGGAPTLADENYLGSVNVNGFPVGTYPRLVFTFEAFNGAYSWNGTTDWQQSYNTNKDQEQYTVSNLALWKAGSTAGTFNVIPQVSGSGGTYTISPNGTGSMELRCGTSFISTHGAGMYYIAKSTSKTSTPEPIEITDTDGTSKTLMNAYGPTVYNDLLRINIT